MAPRNAVAAKGDNNTPSILARYPDTIHTAMAVEGDPISKSLNVNLASQGGGGAVIGTFGELVSAAPHDEISAQFQYSIDTTFDVTTSTSGDGSVSQSGSYAVLSSTTGSCSMQSKDTLRYKPGHTALINFTASFDGAGSGTVGLFDADDGVFLEVENGDIKRVAYRNATSDTQVLKADFDGEDISGIDWSKINVYRIMFGWLGVAPILIQVMQPSGRFITIHKFETPGTLTTTHVGNAVIPIRMETSGDMEIRTASWQGANIGNGSLVGARPFSQDGVTTLSGTNVATLVVFENKSTFQSKTNKVKAKLLRYKFKVDGQGNNEGTVRIQIIGNPVLSGTPSWNDINTASSVMRYDEAQTYSSGGMMQLTDWLGYSSANQGGAAEGSEFDADRLGLVAFPGQQFAIIAQNVNGSANVNVRWTFNWEELF